MKKFLFAATALALSLAMLTSCSSTETEKTQKDDMEGIITAEIPLDRPDDQTQDHDMSSIEVTEPVNDDPMNNARNHNLHLHSSPTTKSIYLFLVHLPTGDCKQGKRTAGGGREQLKKPPSKI